jgi:sugar phosphate isomerase/epimerase
MLSRAATLAATACGASAALSCEVLASGSLASEAEPSRKQSPTIAAPPQVKYCLNMSTVRGQKLSVPQQVDLAAKAGYDAIEPWIGDLQKYVDGGGSIADLKKRIDDAGLSVESAIGFAEWIVDDDARRAKGLEQAKRDMSLVKSIGGKRIAAPPSGATKEPGLSLTKAAERYRALCELGQSLEVRPEVEVWGFSTTLSKLGETMFVAIEAKHPYACVLPDVYHLYKGGSDFESLRLISGQAIQVFHMNDFPAAPPRETIKDADRVYPGDGIAPLGQILRDLFANGFCGVLSLELFNPEYWKQDPLVVAQTGLAKMQASVANSLAGK